MADEDPMEFLRKQREKLSSLSQMGQVAALQNQLALDVQSRMASIEKLLEEPGPNHTHKPDKEVEMWKARIQQLSGPAPGTRNTSIPATSSFQSRKHHRTQREPLDTIRSQTLQAAHAYQNPVLKSSPHARQKTSYQPWRNSSAQETGTKQLVSSGPVNAAGWYRAIDPKSGRPYLFNPETKETKWEHPKSAQKYRNQASQEKQLISQTKKMHIKPASRTENAKPLSIKEALCLSCFDSISSCKCDPVKKSKSSKLCNKCFDIPCQCR